MRKINKIMSGITAATVAFGSLAAYVAFAENVKGTYPAEVGSTFDDISYTAEGDGTAVTVTFTDTRENIDKLVKEKGWNGTEGKAPVYLSISVEATEFSFLAGYELDKSDNPEYNYANGKMMLWLPAIVTGDEIKIEYATEAGTSKGEGTTLTITYKYKDDDEELGDDVTVTVARGDLTAGEGVDEALLADITIELTDSGATKQGGTVDITVAAPEGYKIGEIKFENDTTELSYTNEGDVYTVTIPDDAASDYEITVSVTIVEDDEDDGNGGNTGDGGNTSGGNTGGGDTSKPDDDKPTTPDGVIEGEADVKPGETTVVETDAGDITVKTDAEDTALNGTKFVVDTVEDANKDLTAAVGANASAETKAAVAEAAEAVEDGDAIILDLSFVDSDGKTVQPGKAVTVELPVPAALKGASKVYIYHVGDKGITLVATSDVKDGRISFTTDEFSPYIFSKTELKKAASGATSEPSTSEPGNTSDPGSSTNPSTGVALAVAPVMLAAGAFAVVTFKKKH